MNTKSVMYRHDVPLQEMKRMYAEQGSGLEAIKTSVRTVFSAAGLILAVLGALQVFTASVDPAWQTLYVSVLAAIFLLYLVFIAVCIAGMWPVYWYPVFDDDWDQLTTTFQNMTRDQEDAMYLSALLQALDKNAPIVRRFARLQKTALMLFPMLVMLSLSLAFIPRL